MVSIITETVSLCWRGGTRNPSLLHAATEEAGRMETIAAEVIAWAMALAAVAAAMVAAPAGQATRRISILGRTT
jgi:hypothetical protein